MSKELKQTKQTNKLKTNNDKHLKITWTKVLGVSSPTSSIKTENYKMIQMLIIGAEG